MPYQKPSVYLDNNATTPVADEVFQAMAPFFREHFGNASSVHGFGQYARSAVENARDQVARSIGAAPREMIFTCGGTEADNLAVEGVARALSDRGRHIITTRIEHHAVLRTCERLAEEGFEVTYLEPDASGRVDSEAFRSAVREDTILASVMYVNNETGSVQPLAEISALARENGILVHSDAVQAIGKIPVDVSSLGVDLLSLSGHKFHGPKGVGALFVRTGTQIEPTMLGGGQERGLRGGTENVAGIVGLGMACEEAAGALNRMDSAVRSLRDRLEASVLETIPSARVNGEGAVRAPHVTNISFSGLQGESILVSLDFQGVAVSTGAACASGSVSPSHVLLAMGLEEPRIQSAIRFSLSRLTSEAEIDYAIEAVRGAITRMQNAGKGSVRS